MSKQDIGHLGIFYSKHFLTLTCNSHHMPITPFVKIFAEAAAARRASEEAERHSWAPQNHGGEK